MLRHLEDAVAFMTVAVIIVVGAFLATSAGFQLFVLVLRTIVYLKGGVP